MRFEGTDGLRRRAMERAQNHVVLRGNEYHEDWFPDIVEGPLVLNPIPITALKEDTRAGIYLIKQIGVSRAYVGMASNFSHRFFNGKEDCKANCPARCGCYGHINSTPTTCRSHRIIESGEDFEVYCLVEMDYDTMRVCQAEVDWYYLLIESEYEMVNADWALGVAGFTGRPILSVHIESATYRHFLTIQEAALTCYGDEYGGNAGVISSTVRGFQNQFRGFTHRYATKEELDIYQGRRDVGALISKSPVYVDWMNQKGNLIDSGNRNRNSRMYWRSGPLDDDSLAHLLRYMKGKYKRREKSNFTGVYQFVDEKWRYVAKTNKWKSRGKKRIEETRYGFDFDRAAAIAREKSIIKNGWQEFNKPNFNWEPPKE